MVWNSLDRYRDEALLIIRLGWGAGFIYFHGWPKMTGGVEGWVSRGVAMANFGITWGYEWWGLAAALAEFLGGFAILFGLFFRPTALMLTWVMIAASADNFNGRGDPAHSFKNIWLFAGLVFLGPGKYSLDHWLRNRR